MTELVFYLISLNDGPKKPLVAYGAIAEEGRLPSECDYQ
jgi:hypothetical protein